MLAYAVVGGQTAPASERTGTEPTILSVVGLAVAPRTGSAFKNLDPAYKRASYLERLHSLVVGDTWLVPEHRVAPLPAAVPDLRRLHDNHHDATVTWIGHATVLVELDWGQSIAFKGLTIVCTPAQHGSGRTMVDQGRRLWSSWAVVGSQRFYFAGDTGYYRHFKEIGDTLGPFDLAALPIGSYTPH